MIADNSVIFGFQNKRIASSPINGLEPVSRVPEIKVPASKAQATKKYLISNEATRSSAPKPPNFRAISVIGRGPTGIPGHATLRRVARTKRRVTRSRLEYRWPTPPRPTTEPFPFAYRRALCSPGARSAGTSARLFYREDNRRPAAELASRRNVARALWPANSEVRLREDGAFYAGRFALPVKESAGRGSAPAALLVRPARGRNTRSHMGTSSSKIIGPASGETKSAKSPLARAVRCSGQKEIQIIRPISITMYTGIPLHCTGIPTNGRKTIPREEDTGIFRV